MNLHLNIPKIEELKIKRIDCPTCKKSRFFVIYFEEWYGSSITCLKCGERWSSGEMCERPFERGWRKKSVESIKALYRRMKK